VANAAGNEGELLTFAVTLSAAHTASISVNFATVTGTAGVGDFQARSGTLVFAPGETAKTVIVTTNNDLRIEATETFSLNLSGPTGGATIARGQGIGTIYDIEPPDPMCGEFVC
jgi:hypothetical protein